MLQREGHTFSHCITRGLFSGTLSMLDCNIFPGLGQDYLATEVNMFLLPVQENDGEDSLTKAGYRVCLFVFLF